MNLSDVTGMLCGLLLAIGSLSGVSMAQDGDAARGEKVFRACKACHKVGEDAKNSVGPVLNGVVGRPAGSFAGYKYSGGLKASNKTGLVWSPDSIFQWLAGPTAFVRARLGDDTAKSKMTFKLTDEVKRRDVIAYLRTLTASEPVAGAQSAEVTHGDTPFDSKMGARNDSADPLAGMQRTKQELVMPPFAPEHDQIAKGEPKIVEIELVVEEKTWQLDSEGTEIIALTYNGSIPAPLIVVHQGDYVELTLKNPASNLMEHNIDLHAATGALGGAALTTVSPGEQSVLRFKATKSGAFLYHCAPEGSMTPYHVTHGMTGSILVLPRDGLKDEDGKQLSYDRLYFIGENEFYVPRDARGDFKSYDAAGEDLDDWLAAMRTLIPTHVVFNGRVGALTGKGAMKAKVGESVLFLHVQGNRDTRPHLIGGHGDYVWETGSFASPPLKDQETWFVRGGSAGVALYTFRQPGVYAYLNHNLIEAVELGAAAHVVVEGEWNDDLMTQVYSGPIQ